MLERGDVSKIRSFLLPDMPHCIESSQFSSAKLSDVFTAFGLLFIIMLISFGMSKLLISTQFIKSILILKLILILMKMFLFS